MKKLIIDRQKWLRGEDRSFLLRPQDQKMCCLGFYARACQLKPKDIKGVGAFPALDCEIPEEAKWLVTAMHVNSRDAMELMSINDNEEISNIEREAKIAEIFARHGVEVEFIN